MITKHTPGPWRISGPPSFGTFLIRNADLDKAIADCDWGHSPNESRANARLIAAAPDLLQILIDITAHLDSVTSASQRPGSDSYHVYKLARAAIAKATGEVQ